MAVLIIMGIAVDGLTIKANSTGKNNKIRAKINYTDNPNQSDFYKTNNLDKFLNVTDQAKLQGSWSGNFLLNNKSIYWTNSFINNKKVYRTVDKGPYEIIFNLSLKETSHTKGRQSKLLELNIIQDSVRYSSVNIEAQNDKQINYWAKAEIGNWFEIIRGKIVMLAENKLFTIFQTTVYESGIPIYAFRGKTILNKQPLYDLSRTYAQE